MATADEQLNKNKSARKEQYKKLGALETPAERARRRLTGVLVLVVCLVLSVGAWSAGWWFTSLPGGSAESDTWGTAETRSCEPTGPITLYGVGYWWNCTAEVKWHGKPPAETVIVKGSELTPEDIGKQVRVMSKNFGQPNDHDDNAVVYSDTTRPFWFLNIVMWGGIAVLLGIAAISGTTRAFFPLSEWFDIDKDKAAKYWAKYERDGRLPPELARQKPPHEEPESDFPPPQTGQR